MSHRMTLRSKPHRRAQQAQAQPAAPAPEQQEPSVTVTAAPPQPTRTSTSRISRLQKQPQPTKPPPTQSERRPIYIDNAEYPVETYASSMYEYRNPEPTPRPAPVPGTFVFPRPPVPSKEHASASLLKGRLFSSVVPDSGPRDFAQQQALAQSMQTWRNRVLHAPPADPSTNPERQISLERRIELMHMPFKGKPYRDHVKLGDRSLMAERSEWLDWRLIAGTQYWVCPSCNEHVFTSDIPSHRAAHGIIPVVSTNTN